MIFKFFIKFFLVFFIFLNIFVKANDISSMSNISDAAGSSAQAARRSYWSLPPPPTPSRPITSHDFRLDRCISGLIASITPARLQNRAGATPACC